MVLACELPPKTQVPTTLDDDDKSLPAQWFRDERIYQLERRAIFSKLWILSTHTSRFAKGGDYLKLEYAGYPYLVIRTKEGGYNAFHNVCRHRAFPLVHKETGSSTILGCKYHGWSYSSSTGALIKAPQFAEGDIDKQANGLFKLHVHVTDSGFIFVNFNAAPLEPEDSQLANPIRPEETLAMTKGTASADPRISLELEGESGCSGSGSGTSGADELFERSPDSDLDADPGLDSDAASLYTAPDSSEGEEMAAPRTPVDTATLPLLAEPPKPDYTVRFEEHFGSLPSEWSGFKPEDYEYAYSWTRVGPYNWKTLMDGYQECYHCQVAHPGFAKSLALDTYAVSPMSNYARHTADNKSGPGAIRPEGASEDEAPPSFTFVFPTNGVTVTGTMWYMMRTVPVSATETRMEYDVFRRKSVSMVDLRKYMEFYEQVEDEDFNLCVATQRNLNSGIYSRGFLHPTKEIGVLFYQSRTRAFVEDHLALEKQLKREFNPAQPASQVQGSPGCAGSKADAVCSSLGVEFSW